jgi:hypothetical protein
MLFASPVRALPTSDDSGGDRRQPRGILRRSPLQLLLAFTAALLLGPATSASAAIIHVDKDGVASPCSDTRTREQAASSFSPLCSTTRAVALAVTGDVIDVRAGSYPALTISNRDMATQTVIRAHAGERPVIAGFRVESSDRWTIQGFRTGAQTSLVQYGSREVQVIGNEFSPWGLTAKHSTDLLFEGNYVHDTSIEGTRTESEGYGFRATRNASGTRVVRPVVRNNQFERIHADAVQFGSTDDPVVEGNVARDIRDISDVGEHNDFVQCFPGCPGLKLRNNDVDGAHQGLMLGGNGGAPTPGLVIEGNRLVNVRQLTLNIYDAPGVRIDNNTIWNTVNESRAVRLRDLNGDTSGALVRGNLLDGTIANEAGSNAFAQSAFNYHASQGGVVFEPGSLSELAAGSRGIDEGWRVEGAVDDPNAANRGGPNGSGIGDAGWRERGAGSSPPPPPPPPPVDVPADVPADARWTHSPSSPRVGQVVRFDGTGSTGNGLLSCRWEFTNQSGTTVYQTRTGCLLDFTFQGSGTKWVRLRVTDADGDTDSDLHGLEVSSG